MISSKKYTEESIRSMTYTDFIAFIKETNRCPGGKDTIRRVIQNSFINTDSSVLEVGCNTGFTSLEIARIVNCKVDGIDISESCIAESNNLLSKDIERVRNNVHFQVASAYDIPFPNNTFDLVFVGGATSFMGDKKRAIKEYYRVAKPWGFLATACLYYRESPPADILEAVSDAIGTKIEPWTDKDWLSIFANVAGFELYHYEKFNLESRASLDVDLYVEYFMNKQHIKFLPEHLKVAIKNKWKSYLYTFNLNHNYLGYCVALFRKRELSEEPELFIKVQV